MGWACKGSFHVATATGRKSQENLGCRRARSKARVPSSSLMTVTSMWQYSLGLLAGMPCLGFGGYKRRRGRSQGRMACGMLGDVEATRQVAAMRIARCLRVVVTDG
jgi:hypothetical protein